MCKAVLYYTSISSRHCTIPVSLVDLQLQLLYSCTSIQIQQRVLVALIRIAHGRILRFIYAGPAYLRYSSESSALDPFGLDHYRLSLFEDRRVGSESQ